MDVMTGFNEFWALVVILPFMFSPFLVLVSVLMRRLVWRITF